MMASRLQDIWKETTGQEEDLGALESVLDSIREEELPAEARDRLLLKLRRVALEEDSFRERLEASRPAHIGGIAGILALIRPQVSLLGFGFWAPTLAFTGLGIILTPYLVVYGLWPTSSGAVLLSVLTTAYALRSTYYRTVELELACPIEPGQLMLARVTIVLCWNVLLAILATIPVSLLVPGFSLSELILSWLSPLFLIAGITLVASLHYGSVFGSTIGLVLWGVQLAAREHLGVFYLLSPAVLSPAGYAIRLAMLGLGALLFAVSWGECHRLIENWSGRS